MLNSNTILPKEKVKSGWGGEAALKSWAFDPSFIMSKLDFLGTIYICPLVHVKASPLVKSIFSTLGCRLVL